MMRAEGKVFTGGADVHGFDGPRIGARTRRFEGGLELIQRIEDAADPDAVGRARALPHGRLRALARLRHDLGGGVGQFGLVEAVVGLTPGWGGTQRMAERAGPARAREFVMSGRLYDAATLERWNVVNRVLPEDELLPKATKFAQQLANGPTLAHAATKAIVRAFLDGGVREADRRTPQIIGSLFETRGPPERRRSFLDEGPGKATFEGTSADA